MKHEKHTVIIGIGIASQAGRDVLSGVFSYIERGVAWKPRLIQTESELTNASLKAIEEDGVDGYLLSFGNTGEPRDFLINSRKPLVLIGTKREGFFNRNAPTAFVWNDNYAIGSLGAHHFAILGTFNSYGFVHSTNTLCSEPRFRGFADTLSKSRQCILQEFHQDITKSSEDQMIKLEEWIINLPKPAAVMTAADSIALQVLSAAERKGVKIPGQLMVIGVDNDELLVSHSSPPLTSIHPGHFEMGFKAAAELDRLMSAKQKCSVNSTNIQPLRIVERESTKNVKPAALLVSRAKRFINQKYASGITAQDVTKHLGCSRELIDLRFREIEGITLKAELENCRLTEVKRLLKTTSRPISTIAKQCGFKSTSHLTHLFSLRNGLSPLAWRNAHEDDQMQKVPK